MKKKQFYYAPNSLHVRAASVRKYVVRYGNPASLKETLSSVETIAGIITTQPVYLSFVYPRGKILQLNKLAPRGPRIPNSAHEGGRARFARYFERLGAA
jgi:hypothetical protein